MKIQYELSAIVYKLLLLLLLLTNVNGLPFLFGTSYGSRDHMVDYQTPDDSWNITSVPRSITPHLMSINATQNHAIPPRKTEQQLEDEILKRLHDIKVRSEGWFQIEFHFFFKITIVVTFIRFRRKTEATSPPAECFGLIQPIWCIIHHLLIKH